MKRFIGFILALAILFSLAGCTGYGIVWDKRVYPDKTVPEVEIPSEESTKISCTPLLYKVTDENGNCVWLFGSVHFGVDEFYPLPDYVMDAFNSSESLAVEMNTLKFEEDENAQQEYFYQPLSYPQGDTIKNHIPDSLYNRAVDILKENDEYIENCDNYKPSLWSFAIDKCTHTKMGYDMENGIDRYLMTLAEKNGKEISEVEGAWYHYSVISEFSDDVQLMMLSNSIGNYSNLDLSQQSLDKMCDAWAQGDETALKEIIDAKPQFQTVEQAEIFDEYNNRMMVERDMYMTQYVKSTLEWGKETFVCVGAAHVVGENGIVAQLKELGLVVEVVE